MSLPALIANITFLLLLASIIAWILIYRRLDRQEPHNDRYYRYHQVLIGLIALLAILLALVVVFGSTPVAPDLYMRGY